MREVIVWPRDVDFVGFFRLIGGVAGNMFWPFKNNKRVREENILQFESFCEGLHRWEEARALEREERLMSFPGVSRAGDSVVFLGRPFSYWISLEREANNLRRRNTYLEQICGETNTRAE